MKKATSEEVLSSIQIVKLSKWVYLKRIFNVQQLLKNNERIDEATSKSVLDFEKKKLELKLKRNKKLKEIANKKIETKKEILNSDEKLDKILKDEWGLKKEQAGEEHHDIVTTKPNKTITS